MFYHNLKDLTLAAMSWDNLTKDEKVALNALVEVYFYAIHHPPYGVSGVGVIRYAERQLVLAQERKQL